MIKLKPYHRQMKYFCDKFIGLLAEKVLAPLVNLLQLCLGLELFITEHVLMITDIPSCLYHVALLQRFVFKAEKSYLLFSPCRLSNLKVENRNSFEGH